jgi:host factor-I protein
VAAEKSQNVQDVFLNHVRKSKTSVTVFLVNGVKLQGIITWFDNFSVLLRRDGHTQLVYKHAISTVMPGAPISLFDSTAAAGAAAPAGAASAGAATAEGGAAPGGTRLTLGREVNPVGRGE